MITEGIEPSIFGTGIRRVAIAPRDHLCVSVDQAPYPSSIPRQSYHITTYHTTHYRGAYRNISTLTSKETGT